MALTATAAAPPYQHLEQQRRWSHLETAFWLATLLPFVQPQFMLLAYQIAITALFALSIDLVLGYAGIVTLGHAAFFGLGAYGAGLFSKFVWGEPLTGLVAGAAIAAVAGYLSSWVVVRFRHLAIIMITLGLGLLLHEAANSAHWLTGGADGLQGMDVWPILGVYEFDLWGYTAYTYSLVVLFVLFLCVRRIIHSPFGLSLRGIRENWTRMPAIGAPSLAHLRKVYTLSAAIAGVAGALLAQTTGTVALQSLSFERSADTLVMLVLGGTGRLYGGLVGAIIFMFARDQFSGINPQLWYFWIGLLLVLVVLFLPGGALGWREALDRFRTAWRRAKGRRIELTLRFTGIAAVVLECIQWFQHSKSIGQIAYPSIRIWLGIGFVMVSLIMAALRKYRGPVLMRPTLNRELQQ